jgi:hypothetical protein
MTHDNGNGINSLYPMRVPAFIYSEYIYYFTIQTLFYHSNLTIKYLKEIMGRINSGIHSTIAIP